MSRSSFVVSVALLISLSSVVPAGAQTVYGLFNSPSPDLGKKVLTTVDPVTGTVTRLSADNGAIDANPVSASTGATALAVAGDVFYFIGQNQGGISQIYTVPLDTGVTTSAVAMATGYTASLTFGLWWDEPNGVLYGLFGDSTDRQVGIVNPATGGVTAIASAIAGTGLTTASGLFTGDAAGERVFFIGTPDGDVPTLFVISTAAATLGDVTALALQEESEDSVVGIEWDRVDALLYAVVIVGRDGGRQLATIDVGSGEVLLDPYEPLDEAAPIATASGLSALDSATRKMFFIGRNDASGLWSLYTVELSDGTGTSASIEDATTVQTNNYTGIEIVPGPQLSLTKDDGDLTAVPGDTIPYTLWASNAPGVGTATTVQLVETVPLETTFSAAGSSGTWDCIPGITAGSVCTQDLLDLAPGGAVTVTFAVAVDTSVSAGVTQISNMATLQAGNATDDSTASDTTPVTSAAILGLSKSDGGISTTPGSTVAYTINVANTGNQDAENVVLTDTLPANTTFDSSGSTAGWGGCTMTTCNFSVGTLAGGSSVPVIISVTVDPTVPAGTTEITNQVSATADNATGVMASDSTPVTAAPDLALTKSDGGVSAAPGGVIAYQLGYTNNGDEDTAGAQLVETVPAQTTFEPTTSTGGWVCTPDGTASSTCTLDIGTVAGNGGGASAVFAVTVDDPVEAGTSQIDNSATFNATNSPAPAMASDTTPVDAAVDLRLEKDDGGITTMPGGVVAYALAFRNAGNENAADVVLTETVPDHTEFVPSLSTPGWVCTPDGTPSSTCVLDVGTVIGTKRVVTLFAVMVDQPYLGGAADISNTASIDASNAAAPVPASDTTPVDARLDLSVDKDDGSIWARPGGTIAYVVGWENLANQAATGVEATETVPTGTTFNAASSDAGWVCTPSGAAGSTCTFVVGSLGVGETGTAVFAVTVDDPVTLTQIDNTVTIDDDGAVGPDEDPSNNSFQTSTAIDAVAPVVVGIDASPSIGGIQACSQLMSTLSQVTVDFEDLESGMIDVDHLASYLVVSAGADADFDTTACGPVFGDDLEVPITGIVVSGTATNPTATLSLSSTLGDGLHQLFVCDTLTDAAGNALDGDGDGAAGGDLLLRFRIDVDNLFANAHLDDCVEAPIHLSPWTVTATLPNGADATLTTDYQDSALSGSIDMSTQDGQPVTVDQCVDLSIAGLIHVEVEASVRGASDQNGELQVELWCDFFDAPACSGAVSTLAADAVILMPVADPPWTLLRGRTPDPMTAASARCGVSMAEVQGVASSGHVFVDGARLRVFPILFADGFESGDTSMWSSTTTP